jgi:membrane associated rhomboid family serine protease
MMVRIVRPVKDWDRREKEIVRAMRYGVPPGMLARRPFEFRIAKFTIFFVLLCIVFFALELTFPPIIPLLELRGMELSSRPWAMITCALLHAGFFHLLYNLFAIFMLGSVLEINYSSNLVFLIALISALIASAGFVLLSPTQAALGASGIVFGLIGAAVLLAPNVRIFFPLGFLAIPIPIRYAGPLLALGELLLTFVDSGHIAHSAHLFGFIGGIGIGLLILKMRLELDRRRTALLAISSLILSTIFALLY